MFTSLPADMSALRQLQYLSLCSSLIEDLEPLITLPGLKKLRIGYRGLDYPNLSWLHPEILCPDVIPPLPKGLSITELYVHGLIRVNFGAYNHHTLDVLDIHRSTEGVGQHLIKQFKQIKSIIGFTMHSSLPNHASLTPKMRYRIITSMKNGTVHSKYEPGRTYRLSNKIEHGTQIYNALSSVSFDSES